MAQTRTEANEVLTSVREALDLRTLRPPRGLISSAFREVEKKLTFGRGSTPYSLADSVGYLCAYGYYQRAVDAAVILARIDPLTWDISYLYVRDAIHTAYFFALHAGDRVQSMRIEPYLALPGKMDAQLGRDRYEPNVRVMDGTMLARPFESTIDPSPEHPIKYSDRIASSAVGDLRGFAPMWIFGGSTDWPRERIIAEVNITLAELYELPDWQPW